MALIKHSQHPPPLVSAINALREEQFSISKQMELLRHRYEKLQVAITAMEPLVDGYDFKPSDEVSWENESIENSYEGMRFTKALRTFMQGMPYPMSAAVIAKVFAQSGWVFNSEKASDQANQVGVTFRRYEGQYFKRHGENTWTLIDYPSEVSN